MACALDSVGSSLPSASLHNHLVTVESCLSELPFLSYESKEQSLSRWGKTAVSPKPLI